MAIVRLCGVAIAATAAAMVVRAYRKELGMQVSIAAGAVFLICAVKELEGIYGFMAELTLRFGLDPGLLALMLKAVGVTYLVEFACDLARDAGESAIAGKAELVGRLMILSLSLPVMASIIDIAAGLLGGAG